MFTNATEILTTNKYQPTETNNLQMTVNKQFSWAKCWKIKINGNNLVHVNYTLRKYDLRTHISSADLNDNLIKKNQMKNI